MTVQAVDDYYYTPVQSTADYSSARSASQADAAGGTNQMQGAQASPDSRSRQQDQALKLYFFDERLGQYVNLLV